MSATEAREALRKAINWLTPVPGRPYCACTDSGLCLAHARVKELRAALAALPDDGRALELFEAGRATGTVEGWADYTETRHDDEYDALARQFHESIAEGQSIADTAKALRILALPDDGREGAYQRGYKDGRAAERWEQTHGESR